MASGQSSLSSHSFPAAYSTHGHAHTGAAYHHAHHHHPAHHHHSHLSQTSLHAQYSNTLQHLSSVAASAGRSSSALLSNGQTTPTVGSATPNVAGLSNGITSATAAVVSAAATTTMNHLGSTMYATKRRRRNSKKYAPSSSHYWYCPFVFASSRGQSFTVLFPSSYLSFFSNFSYQIW